MATGRTVFELLGAGDEDAPAIAALGRPPLTYGALRRHVERTVASLDRLGIGRGDVVAMVLPNGPELAAAFVAVACGATTAPLNPAYREEEFEHYLRDLGARLLLVEQGSRSPARSAAERLGIVVAELIARPEEAAGAFDLAGSPVGRAGAPGHALADDVALVLHTSGTTARPKVVPLTHSNVCASARHIATTLRLRPEDRCLNIMPLFHIHGLMAAVLATLDSGGCLFCAPGFNALKFFAWIGEADPTWYTGVPTMHQAILARAGRGREAIARGRLRLVRSSSASLPPRVMKALEEAFGAPVIEAYGMAEAAHQMASNPLPPGERKRGSVGPAAGPEIAVMDEKGTLLAPGSAGEVVVRGPNVMRGYRNNPGANRAAFVHGWFRTGDQGVIDGDGYLRLTGRLKEIINRGGEKISPREVDEVLLEHHAVAQAVTFAVPHDKLGEDVAAAVVLHEGESVAERELRAFARAHLADFKVPATVVFVPEIPKGPTGKLQRIGLAQKLGLA
jgi:acyl-CoA synthetase (AMP-forming)/AMP-acid ligase II